ncbi:hypothetical protein GCM10027443_43450 [Pontibacter brevis]
MMWDKSRLGTLVEPPISGEWGNGEGTTKVIRTTNFTNSGRLDLSNVVQRNIDTKKIQQKRLLYGDMIIEKSGGSPTQPVGRVVFFDATDDTYLCNNFTSVLRAKSAMNPRYLFWHLFYAHQSGQTLRFQNKTTGIINLQLKRYLEETQISTPPIEIQNHIADTLDKADALRRKDQELLLKYDNLTQSIFYDMFGDPVRNEKEWDVLTIRELVREVKYGTSSPASTVGEYPYLRMNNITYSGELDLNDLKRIDANPAEYVKYGVQRDDILFNRTNSKELVGKTTVVDTDQNMIAAGYLIRVRCNNLANPHFISAFLNCKEGKGILRNMCKSIVGMANINAQELQNIRLITPPKELQDEFAQRILSLKAIKQLAVTNVSYSHSLFNSQLQRYFHN